MSHPDNGTIERFVMGALEDDAEFVAHVAGCDVCSAKLQREAKSELAMFDARAGAGSFAEAQPAAALPRFVRSKIARRAIGPAVAFAAAAAMIAWVRHDRGRSQRDSIGAGAVRVVSCPDGAKQVACIAEAHRSGAQLEYPKGTSLAALGSVPGVTVHLEPSSSDGTPAEIDAFFAKAGTELKICAEKAIVLQDAPIVTGEVGVKFTIGPDGRVQESGTNIVIYDDGMPDLSAPTPQLRADMTMARCLATTAQAFPFKGNGEVVRVGVTAKYVWRE